MRKRIVKKRKRIKQSIGGKTAPKKSSSASATEKRGSALVELGRRAVERSRQIWETEDVPENDASKSSFKDRENAFVCGGRRMDTLKLVCGFVVVFSIFAAVVITCFSFAVAVKHSDSTPIQDSVSDTSAETEGKVVFVRPAGSELGILSAPEIYAKCAPSVVSVTAKLSAEHGGGRGIGTGFVLSEDGYIATACHVVTGAEELFVVMSDGKQYEAQIIAAETMSDIALLKIEAGGLAAVEFGLSSELLAGERVYAIGTPAAIEYAGTLSSGEISHPNRLLPIYSSGGVLEKKLRLIQTNAELSAGCSGSPLFDEYGKVVGIVTMKLGGDYSGIGFALPSDGALSVLGAMMEGRELNGNVLSGVVVFAPKLGIIGESAEVGGAYGYKITGFDGVVSSTAGALRIDDLIVEIDNAVIYREGDITDAINKKCPDDTVSITVIRSGQRLTFDVILGK